MSQQLIWMGALAASGVAEGVTQIEHTLVAAVAGPTFGYQDADGTPGTDGSFTPDVSAGIRIVRMLFGGAVSSATFGMEGQNQPDNDSSWRQVRVTGTFQGGFQTRTFIRANANSYNPTGFPNETAWGYGPITDGFIAGNSYSVFIDDRIG